MMKPLFRCEYCNYFGTEEEVAEHERDCEYNPLPTKHSCKNCAYRCVNHCRNEFSSRLCESLEEYCGVDGYELAHGLPHDKTCDKWKQGKHCENRAI